MRKVILTMDEQNKYETIKKLVETNGNKQRAALKLGCTTRTINRLIIKYRKEGKAGFMHVQLRSMTKKVKSWIL